VKWPTFASTAPPASLRSSASTRRKLRRCGHWKGRSTFQPIRECVRRVHADACIELEANRYSVPWRLIGETVTVLVNEQVRILQAGQEVAIHTRLAGQRRASIQREHLIGVVGSEPLPRPQKGQLPSPAADPELLRPLQEYEAVTGGAW